jgi:hypothetical protein
MDVQVVSLFTARSVDVQGVSFSTTNSMDVQGVPISTTSSVNIQGVFQSIACRVHVSLSLVPEFRTVQHPVSPVLELTKMPIRNQFGTGIRGPIPVPEMLQYQTEITGTGM